MPEWGGEVGSAQHGWTWGSQGLRGPCAPSPGVVSGLGFSLFIYYKNVSILNRCQLCMGLFKAPWRHKPSILFRLPWRDAWGCQDKMGLWCWAAGQGAGPMTPCDVNKCVCRCLACQHAVLELGIYLKIRRDPPGFLTGMPWASLAAPTTAPPPGHRQGLAWNSHPCSMPGLCC